MKTCGVIAAGSEQSAAAGEECLRLGGNAVDAAVAAAFATAAGDPAICSLGGGGALVFRDGATGSARVCDFFADAPGLGSRRLDSAAGTDFPELDFHALEIDFQAGSYLQRFHIGRAAAAVPGILSGLCAAREHWGVLPLEALIDPTIRFLRDGIELTEYQAMCNIVLSGILGVSEFGRAHYFASSGEPLAAGERFCNCELADALQSLATLGLSRFQEEVLFPAVLSDFGEAVGGRITPEDLQRSTPRFREPLSVGYGGAELCTNPPPSFGGRFICQTLELFDRLGVRQSPAGSAERYLKLAAIFRAISELRVEQPDLADRADAIQILEARIAAILRGAAPTESSTKREPAGPGNTTHVSVLDEHGNAVAVTLSHGEGNGHVISGTGILMNNLLGEEDLFPGGFHKFTPGERLKTMMAPTILVEPSGAITALGSGGSNRIRTVIPQFVVALLDDEKSLGEAIGQARVHLESGTLSFEDYLIADAGTALSEAAKLAEILRPFKGPSLFFGGVHAARLTPRFGLQGVGDFRRSGAVRVVE
ncbi:MAG: gamma-glutamyltransferase [Planctomycetes bacterium]|nr:gamma-glutamyltransferase [Planctomycetota bacterium]